MNLSRFLPGFAKGKDAPEHDPAEEKAERIRFTRERVRNGPIRKGHRPLETRYYTQGQVDRAFRRAQKVQTKRSNVRARRDWIRANQQLSRLRGQLEVISREKRDNLYEAAMRGLFDGYGSVVAPELVDPTNSEGLLPLDFHNEDHRSLVVQAALHHYKIATGQAVAA